MEYDSPSLSFGDMEIKNLQDKIVHDQAGHRSGNQGKVIGKNKT